MRSLRLVLIATLLALPFAATAKAQAGYDVGVGPEVGAAPMEYGPPVCEWGYYSYSPYGCAPYGYYALEWFFGGLFIGAGPWYNRGWYGRGGYGYRGGYGNRGGYGGRGGYYGSRGGKEIGRASGR